MAMNPKRRKKWFVSAVRKCLIFTWGMNRWEASKAIEEYELNARIDECPFIAEHDEPESIAEDIWLWLPSRREKRNRLKASMW